MLPKSFGRYEVTGEIGDGAMGRVYSGWDPFVRRAVAVKTLKRELLIPGQADAALRRFRREAQAAGALSHPHIVNVFDVGDDYIVMELIEGASLQAILRARGQLPLGETVAVLAPAADALDHAHRAGVIHRDVKPGNIMVLPDGRPKLTDFGLARLDSAAATRPGEVFGSPSYMAPEQVTGAAVTPRADVYALAVVAYECLTGCKPFEGATVAGIVYKVLHEPPPPPRRFAPDLPEHCDAVFARALAKEPGERYGSAAGFLRALQGLEEGDATVESKAWKTPRGAAGVHVPPSPGEPTRTYDGLPEPPSAAALGSGAAHTPAGLFIGRRPQARRRLALSSAALLVTVAVAGGYYWLPREKPAAAVPMPEVEPWLDVVTEPEGASVYVDGRTVGTSPVRVGPLAPGSHAVRVTRPGFAPAQLGFDVAPGVAPAPLRFVLQPLTATLAVQSAPAGAVVRLGDQEVGRTPIAGLAVPPGVHEVTLELKGYAPWRRTLAAGAGEEAVVDAKLTPGTRPTPQPSVKIGDLVKRGTPGVREPRRVSGEAPAYPATAQRARLQGSVLVSILVDEHGRPSQVLLLESAGELLDRAVLEAVRTWRFAPARKDGVRVKYPLLWRQTFQL